MTLAPLLSAPLIVQAHVAAALAALVLGPFALLRKRRDNWHRCLGYGFVLAMALAALSSFGIHEARQIGDFSVIHLLSVFTLWQLGRGIAHARSGRIAAHRGAMLGLYLYGIGGAGLFTLLPGRRISAVLAAEAPWLGFALAAVVVAVVARVILRQAAGPQPRA